MNERRRKSSARKSAAGEVNLVTEPGSRFSASLKALLINCSESGVCVELTKALPLGLAVQVELEGEIWQGSVCWMTATAAETYRAGIEAERTNSPSAGPSSYTADLYEILQVNQRSDFDLIHRVYRMLAQRFHPDNTETGDEQKFQELLAAYEILSNPEKRAAYDVKLASQRRTTWTVFQSRQDSDGPAAEKRKRTMALAVMYRKRLRQPATPEVPMQEFENVLGIEKEHLEFTFWYLRDKGLATRSDGGRYSITPAGVDTYEACEAIIDREERKAITA